MNDFVESLFVELIIPNGKNILVGVIYRPPNSNIANFNTYLYNLVHNPVFVNKNIFLDWRL